MITYIFNPKKAAQSAAYLLRLHGGKMEYIKLIKLLYLADRASMVHTGFPITGDQMVSLPKGPVLTNILDYFSCGKDQPGAEDWFNYISESENYSVSALPEAERLGFDELSRYEMKVLEQIHEKFGQINKWKLVDLLHQILPEWKDPEGSALWIKPEEIFRLENKSQKFIEEVSSQAREMALMTHLSTKDKN